MIIAASGDQKALLEEEFPFLTFVDLPGYGIKYGKNRALTLLKIVSGIPKILIRVKQERAWLRRFIAREHPDAVISDNRYGLSAKGLFSVFITHQLGIQTPFGNIGNQLLQRMNYRYIRRFSICWVPDLEKEHSLAGELSYPGKLPEIPVRYIGLLSRFTKEGGKDPDNAAPAPPHIADLLILLSGPEPQRTLFERTIIGELPSYPGTVLLVRGRPGKKGGRRYTIAEWSGELGQDSIPGLPEILGMSDRLKIYDHLPAKALNTVVCGAEWVIARSGYSSIMDLLKLGKKTLLVPTPGQMEQEYLGAWLSRQQLAASFSQEGFSLTAALKFAKNFPYQEIGPLDKGQLGEVIKELMAEIAGF